MDNISGLTIFGTCVYGGGLVTFSVDYLSELLRTVKWLWRRQGPPCYPVLALWPAVLCLGLAVQLSFSPQPHHSGSSYIPLIIVCVVCISSNIYVVKTSWISNCKEKFTRRRRPILNLCYKIFREKYFIE